MSTGLGKRAERVYCFLRQQIDTGQLLPGRRLPTQHELSRDLGVSRSTVQTALQQLIDEGRVRSRRGSGMFVLGQPVGDARLSKSNLIAVMCEMAEVDGFSLQAELLRREHLACFHFQRQSDWNLAEERVFLQQLLRIQPKALIACCSPTKPTNADCIQDLSRVGCRVIHTAPYTRELPRTEYLMPDYRAAGLRAGEALASGGYDCYLSAIPPATGPRAWLMEEGFAAALRTAGRDYRQVEELGKGMSKTSCSSAIAQELFAALNSGKTVGVLACAEWMVHVLSQELSLKNVDVPRQVGIVACENERDTILPEGKGFDAIGFDLRAIMTRAIGIAVDLNSPLVHELVQPVFVSRNTIR